MFSYCSALGALCVFARVIFFPIIFSIFSSWTVDLGLTRPLPFDQVRSTDHKLLSFPLKDQGRLTCGEGGLARNRVGLAPKFHPISNRKATDKQMIRKGFNLIHRELIIHYPGSISNCPLTSQPKGAPRPGAIEHLTVEQ